MTRRAPWDSLGNVAPEALRDVTLELHWAAQYLAAAGQTFAEPLVDDSHRAMSWDAVRREFVSSAFRQGYPFRVALRPADLTLQLLDRTDEPLGSFPLAGRTREEGFEWMAKGLSNYMGSWPEIARPEYDMPDHPVAEGAPFSAGRSEELAVLSALYETSAGMLADVVTAFEGASPVRCWPHHFDIATLVTVSRDDEGAAASTVGIGMAPMGGGHTQWYWYATPWPYPEAEALPEHDGPGGWHTEDWVGAVLTGDELVRADADFRESVVRKFIDVSVAASMQVLGGS